jgi:hypothetical protein
VNGYAFTGYGYVTKKINVKGDVSGVENIPHVAVVLKVRDKGVLAGKQKNCSSILKKIMIR